MTIVTLNKLRNMPNGTLFCSYVPDMLDGDWNIITGHQQAGGFYSTLPISPSFYGDEKEKITNWCTTDTHDFDYNKDKLFAVFSKTEIRALITVLQYALSDCSFDITKFEDTYFLNDNEINERELREWM